MPLKGAPCFLHSAGEAVKAQRGVRLIRGHTASQTLAVSQHPPVQEGFLESNLPRVPRRDQRSHKSPRPGQRSPPWTLVTLPLGGRGCADLGPEQRVLSLRFSVGWEQPVLTSFLSPLAARWPHSCHPHLALERLVSGAPSREGVILNDSSHGLQATSPSALPGNSFGVFFFSSSSCA